MLFTNTLIAVAFAALVVANPVARDAPTTCRFIMTPSPDLGAASLQTDINYAIGHTVGTQYVDTTFRDDNEPLVRHDDGTYDVQSAISVNGVPKSDVAAFVNTWAGLTLNGIEAQWKVGAASCV